MDNDEIFKRLPRLFLFFHGCFWKREKHDGLYDVAILVKRRGRDNLKIYNIDSINPHSPDFRLEVKELVKRKRPIYLECEDT